MTDCDIAVIDAGTFRELIKQYGNIAILVLREMSLRVKNATGRIGNLAHEWIKLVMVLYFLKEWPFPDDADYESEIAGLTGKETWEIRGIINELIKAGIFEQEGNVVRGFRKERIWGILGSTEAKLGEAL